MKTYLCHPLFYQSFGCSLRNFSKKLFYKWDYLGHDTQIDDFFSMYQMGGEL